MLCCVLSVLCGVELCCVLCGTCSMMYCDVLCCCVVFCCLFCVCSAVGEHRDVRWKSRLMQNFCQKIDKKRRKQNRDEQKWRKTAVKNKKQFNYLFV